MLGYRATVEPARAVHRGGHRSTDVTYGQLGSWVVEHTLAVADPLRETHLVGPAAAGWRTEIGRPAFRIAR